MSWTGFSACKGCKRNFCLLYMNWINSLNSHDARNNQSFHRNTTPRFAEDGRGPIEGYDFFAYVSLQGNFHQANCISLDRLLWYRAPRSWRISGTADIIVVIWVFALRLVFVVFATFRVAYIRQTVTTKAFGRDVDIIRFCSARKTGRDESTFVDKWLVDSCCTRPGYGEAFHEHGFRNPNKN